VDVSSLSPSSDGHQLAFVSDRSGRPGLWMMNADGTGLTQLTDANFEQFPYAVGSIAWTPT
jgi:Tol biopolymer transport system component